MGGCRRFRRPARRHVVHDRVTRVGRNAHGSRRDRARALSHGSESWTVDGAAPTARAGIRHAIDALDAIRTARPIVAVLYAGDSVDHFHRSHSSPDTLRFTDRRRVRAWHAEHPVDTNWIISRISRENDRASNSALLRRAQPSHRERSRDLTERSVPRRGWRPQNLHRDTVARRIRDDVRGTSESAGRSAIPRPR